jgi:hypothetical protein
MEPIDRQIAAWKHSDNATPTEDYPHCNTLHERSGMFKSWEEAFIVIGGWGFIVFILVAAAVELVW